MSKRGESCVTGFLEGEGRHDVTFFLTLVDPCTTACLVGHEMSGFFRIISSGSGMAGKMRPAHSLFLVFFSHHLLLTTIHPSRPPASPGIVCGWTKFYNCPGELHVPASSPHPIDWRFPESEPFFPPFSQILRLIPSWRPTQIGLLSFFARPTNFFRAHTDHGQQ